MRIAPRTMLCATDYQAGLVNGGRARFEAPRGPGSALFGRAESVGQEYRARFTAHGEKIARAATRLGWSMTAHRTDHAPQAALIALHAAIGPS